MTLLSLITNLILIVLFSACSPKVDVAFYGENSKSPSNKNFFLNVQKSYELSENTLTVPVISAEVKNKYPSASFSCVFQKDLNTTDHACADLMPNLEIDISGKFKWKTTYIDNGEYHFFLKVSYGNNSNNKEEEKDFVIIVNNINRAPLISSIANQSINENQAISTIIPIASDPDADAIVFECRYSIGSITEESCTDLGAIFNTNLGSLSWTPTGVQAGDYAFKIIVRDGVLSAEAAFTIKVAHINQSPVILSLSNLIAFEEMAITAIDIAAKSSDADGDTLSYSCQYDSVVDGAVSAGSSCAGLGISFNSNDGLFNWTPGIGVAGIYEIKIIVSDGALSASQIFTATVKSKAPFITEWQTTTINEVIALPLSISYAYNFTVNWGDGTATQTITSNSAQHTYANPGLHLITIKGVFPALNFDQGIYTSMAPKLIRVVDLGDVGWRSLSRAFFGAINLTSFKGGETSNVFEMDHMFVNAKSLVNLDVSTFDTSKVLEMANMFSGLEKIKHLDLSQFDTSKVRDMTGMFNSCFELETLNLSSFKTSEVTNMSAMFANLRKITSLDVSKFDTSKVFDMSNMFMGMRAITALDLSSFNTISVTNMLSMFEYTYELTSLNLSSFDTSNVINMSYMFSDMRKMPTLNLSHFKTEKVTSMNSMFKSMYGLTYLNLTGVSTPEVLRMDQMFYGLSSLTTLLIPNLSTPKVTNANSMFGYSSSLTSLNLANFNTANLEEMGGMFVGMTSLTALNVKHFNTAKVKSMAVAFSGLNLAQLDLSTFDTQALINTIRMFENSTIPKVLFHGQTTANPAKASWDTSNVILSTDTFLSSSIGAYCYGIIIDKTCDFDPTTF